MKHFILSILIACGMEFAVIAAPAKVIQETIEAAVKISGKHLPQASRIVAAETLEKFVAKYGDDILKTVGKGGLETLQAGTKYGDDFWRLAKNAKPSVIRSLALHADDLMPIAKRLGKSFITLEGKVPGLGSRVVAEFGDDAAVMLAEKASPDDISKLVGLASLADSPAAKKELIKAYQKGGSKFLGSLNWKHIAATGLSTATIIAAYNISNGVKDGLVNVSENDPKTFVSWCKELVEPLYGGMWMVIILLLLPLTAVIYKITIFICHIRKKHQSSDKEFLTGNKQNTAVSAAKKYENKNK